MDVTTGPATQVNTSADEIADGDFAWGSGQAIPPAAADFAFEESAAAEGEEDGLEEFIGQIFRLGEIAGLDEPGGPESSQLNHRSQAVFGTF